MLYVLISLLLLGCLLVVYFNKPDFGKKPSAQHKAILQKSSYYKNGSFINLEETPDLAPGKNFISVLFIFLFRKSKDVKPPHPVTSVKTDLYALQSTENCLVWFGHSSYFIQINGLKILIDPVFSGNASPIPGTNKSFEGSDIYTAADIPDIDYLIITHDHWDHLDYKTVINLREKVKNVVTPLGVGSHLNRWGFKSEKITELDWGGTAPTTGDIKITAVPARHFSGRDLKRNGTLWAAFILTCNNYRLFIGGDSGYGNHFKKIGTEYGPFDIAILECGQYNEAWPYIHMMPEETVKAAIDLQAASLLPVHWGKFALSLHDWDEPVKRIKAASEAKGTPLIMPQIGKKIALP
ncbi:MBL fold metallo-hydrolase [Flavobacterium coralii]|uniref:MBL fold metallo-hydrolase n=1 Tax=Flavobacterium coralii TaxID=2838017 RepID=UPI0032B16AA8|tara:strand:- start:8251 stop:9306 length:1056 start_codon:yes stop_codon:yes gene_type:complete